MAGRIEETVTARPKAANEIEYYLLTKVNNVITAAEGDVQSHGDKLVTLLTELQDLKKLLEKKPNPDVQNVSKATLYRLNNVLTEWQVQSKNDSSSSSPAALILATKNLSSNLKKIKKEIKLGDSRSGLEGSISLDSDVQESTQKKETYRWSSRSVDVAKVHGLDHQVMSLQRLLVGRRSDNDFKAIGIFGTVGVGKTTLCQVIFNKQEVKNHFLPRIWVCLSKQPKDDGDNRKEIVKRMLMCLGVEEEIINSVNQSHGLDGLLCALHLQLKGKRYLVVLDDAWSTHAFCKKLEISCLPQDGKWGEKLAYGLPKGYGGSVIVTSRSKEVATNMVREENIRHLLPLSDPDSCWLIFKDSVMKEETEFPSELENLKDEIVKNCAGIPSVAKMLGQLKQQLLENKPGVDQNQKEANQQEDKQSTR